MATVQTSDPIIVYVDTIAAILGHVLGSDLLAVYLSGSAALGDFEPATSDVDLIAVTQDEPDIATRERVVRAIAELTCPARGLEFVLYSRRALAGSTASHRWSINLNLGPRLRRTVWWFDPGRQLEYWVTLDMALVRERGRAIVGPSPTKLVGPVHRSAVVRALAMSLEWHTRFDRGRPNRVLNACRAWRYLEVGDLVSKASAAEWAETRTRDALIEQAMRLRTTAGFELDANAVDAFVAGIEAAILAAVAKLTVT